MVEADVGVVVDQAGHEEVSGGAEDLGCGVLGLEGAVVAYLAYNAVLLLHRAVGDDVGGVGAGDAADDIFGGMREVGISISHKRALVLQGIM